MSKKIFSLLMLLSLPAASLFAQEATANKTKTSEVKKAEVKDSSTKKQKVKTNKMFHDITIEDFETTVYNNDNFFITRTKNQDGALKVCNTYPAPIKDSKKYLGIKIKGRHGDNATIKLNKGIKISQYCRSISLWVYGKDLGGELSIIILDSEGIAHRLSFGHLSFQGWKKLTVPIPKKIVQQDFLVNKPSAITVTKILYYPASRTEQPVWNYIYIDDMTAEVRDKFKDRQNDNW